MARIQRYVSEELTHFVGRHQTEEERFELLIKIIKDGWILHRPFNPNISGNIMINTAADGLADIVSPEITCFADIPIEDLSLHMDKYSKFGLAFKREFLVSKGANPVFYIVQNGSVKQLKNPAEILSMVDGSELEPNDLYNTTSRDEWFKQNVIKYFEMMQYLGMIIRDNAKGPGVPHELHLLNDLDNFLVKNIFAYLKPFDAAKSDNDEDNYYMEREWRIVGNLKFEIKDVSRILVPKKYGRKLRESLPDFYGQVTFTD